MSKEYSIAVWNIQFYRQDEDGNEELDENGNIKLYEADWYDCSHLADGIELEDLREVKQ
jgi:hypothetical protein